MLDLTPEQLLTTTRAVRRRLDVDRPVDRETIRHCLSIATQAPTSVNLQNWHFVVVTDATVRAGVAEWYRRAWQDYSSTPLDEDPPGEASGAASSRHLARVMPRVPVLLIPCIEGGPRGRRRASWPPSTGRSCKPRGTSSWPPERTAWGRCSRRTTWTTSARLQSCWASPTTPSPRWRCCLWPTPPAETSGRRDGGRWTTSCTGTPGSALDLTSVSEISGVCR